VSNAGYVVSTTAALSTTDSRPDALHYLTDVLHQAAVRLLRIVCANCCLLTDYVRPETLTTLSGLLRTIVTNGCGLSASPSKSTLLQLWEQSFLLLCIVWLPVHLVDEVRVIKRAT
jgi:hypothetical protein